MSQPDSRVSVSLSQLRAELTGLELRLVDRLNGALVNKADRAIQDQLVANLSDVRSRLTIMESKALVKDGPLAQMVEAHQVEMAQLRSLANYKRWIWAQSVALLGLGMPVFIYFMNQVISA